MAGRKPHTITLTTADKRELYWLRRSGELSERQSTRALILLCMDGDGSKVDALARDIGVNPSTVWRVCRRYEKHGLSSINDRPRPGRTPSGRNGHE